MKRVFRDDATPYMVGRRKWCGHRRSGREDLPASLAQVDQLRPRLGEKRWRTSRAFFEGMAKLMQEADQLETGTAIERTPMLVHRLLRVLKLSGSGTEPFSFNIPTAARLTKAGEDISAAFAWRAAPGGVRCGRFGMLHAATEEFPESLLSVFAGRRAAPSSSCCGRYSATGPCRPCRLRDGGEATCSIEPRTHLDRSPRSGGHRPWGTVMSVLISTQNNARAEGLKKPDPVPRSREAANANLPLLLAARASARWFGRNSCPGSAASHCSRCSRSLRSTN